MKNWNCPDCGAENTGAISLACKNCPKPRPRKWLPKDVVFPLYSPLDPSDETNKRVTLMERMLRAVPQIPKNDKGTIIDFLIGVRKEEKERPELEQDYDLIEIIDSFIKQIEIQVEYDFKEEIKKLNSTSKRVKKGIPVDETEP